MNFNSLIPKQYIEREIETDIQKFLYDREIIVIRGPRQSGKSTLLRKIGTTLQKRYGENTVYYFDLEDEIEEMKFEKNPKDYVNFFLRDKKKIYILIDEIQYVKRGGKILKVLYEYYPYIKFIVSGSSSLDINQLGRYLVGRSVFFELYPFSFSEFLKAGDENLFQEYRAKRFSIKNPKKTESIHIDRLHDQLKEYLTYGGYPRIVLEKDREKKKVLLKNLFSTYIEKDIIKLYGIRYKEKAINMLKYMSATIGNLVNYNDICNTNSMHFQEVKELISIFEETYVLKKILPFHKNLITELKKNPKIYFYDLGLRNILLERFEFSEDEWGKILENYFFLVYKQNNIHFWRTTAKAEVDFILTDKVIPIEVKSTPKVNRSFMSFISSYHPSFGMIANFEKSDLITKNKTKIFIVPLGLI